MARPTDEQYRTAAKRIYHEEGTLEVEDDAPVSADEDNSDGGAWVQSWIWVADSDVNGGTEH